MIKTKNKNIVILNHHANSPDTGGGGRHYELSRCLSELGYNVTVLASSYDNGKRSYRFTEKIKEVNFNDRFKFVSFKTKPDYSNTIGRFINYIDYKNKTRKYDNFSNKPDVIIASSVHPLAWISGYELSRKYNAKYIVEVRDLWPLSMYEDLKGISKKAIFTYFESLEEKYYGLADEIITTAPFVYEYMEEKYSVNKEKVHYIPHGLDIDEFDNNSEIEDKILDKDLKETLQNNFCVTYTGSLSKSEGLPTLIESAKYLKDIKDLKIVIVGSGSEEENLKKIIREENLDNVIMIVRQARNTMALTLKKSDILFCGLMEREAFKYGISKNKFYDYMAAEKPIIFASNVRGSLIDKSKSGITIEPHNPKKLADTIKYIYENIDGLGKEYAENGRKYVEEHHTNEIIAKQFLDVINKS